MKQWLDKRSQLSVRDTWLAAYTVSLFAAMAAGCGTVVPEAPALDPTPEPTADGSLNPERRGIGAEPLPEDEGRSALTVTVDPRRSLAVTDQAILSQFTFQEVMAQLVAQAGVPGLTSLQLFQQWWDSERPAPGLGLGPHCSDSGIANMNSFPFECPRAEGNQATVDPFSDPTGPNSYMPIGLFNRFDLAPTDGANCGEYRIIFAKRSGITAPTNRNLVIFEAVLPNPSPSLGLEGCRPVANFWANLTTNNDVNSRATALKNFYFTGLSGFLPAIHVDNYGNRASNTGQVRANQFMQFNWQLREFKLRKTCGTSCTLQFVPVTVKTNPAGTLFSPSSTHSLASTFQSTTFPGQVSALAVNDINGFNMVIPDNFNSGQSDEMSAENNYATQLTTVPSAFRTNIQSVLNAISSTLTPDQIVARAQALSCAGCHQLSNGADLGGGLPHWPASRNFVHVSEEEQELSPDGGNRFLISTALSSTFLPHRKAVLESFINSSCGDDVCQAWEFAKIGSCTTDCGCPHNYTNCCGRCVNVVNACTNVLCGSGEPAIVTP